MYSELKWKPSLSHCDACDTWQDMLWRHPVPTYQRVEKPKQHNQVYRHHWSPRRCMVIRVFSICSYRIHNFPYDIARLTHALFPSAYRCWLILEFRSPKVLDKRIAYWISQGEINVIYRSAFCHNLHPPTSSQCDLCLRRERSIMRMSIKSVSDPSFAKLRRRDTQLLKDKTSAHFQDDVGTSLKCLDLKLRNFNPPWRKMEWLQKSQRPDNLRALLVWRHRFRDIIYSIMELANLKHDVRWQPRTYSERASHAASFRRSKWDFADILKLW